MEKANKLENAGEYEEAFKIRKECYDYCLEKLGEDHPGTLKALMNLSLSYRNSGATTSGRVCSGKIILKPSEH